MTPELWAIVGVGVALAGLMLSGQRRLGVRMDRIEKQIADLRERTAH